uniref:PNPLA domain-containing protein n=1 Tax=Strigamia maritima TaxID=126957 RepID=T1INB6_STRMM
MRVVLVSSLNSLKFDEQLSINQQSQLVNLTRVVHVCGQPQKTPTEAAPSEESKSDTASNGSDKIVPVRSISSPDLYTRLQQLMRNLSPSKNFFSALADTLCSDDNLGVRSDTNCWNGEGIGEYTKTLVGFGMSAQKYNPEMESVQTMDEKIAQLVDKLKHIRQVISSRTNPVTPEADSVMNDGSGSGYLRKEYTKFNHDDDEDYGSEDGSGSGYDGYDEDSYRRKKPRIHSPKWTSQKPGTDDDLQIDEISGGSTREEKIDAFAGTSGGSLVATLMAVDTAKVETMANTIYEIADDIRSRPLRSLTPGYHLTEEVKLHLHKLLPENAHVLARNKTFISVTNVSQLKNSRFTDFESKEELIQCLMCSCFIPVYDGFRAPTFRGRICIDGAYTSNLPRFSEGRTIVVTPFSGELDISPIETGCTKIIFRQQLFCCSISNAIRLQRALFPPPQSVMEKYHEDGFQDAVQFLKREGWLEFIPRYIPVKSENRDFVLASLTMPLRIFVHSTTVSSLYLLVTLLSQTIFVLRAAPVVENKLQALTYLTQFGYVGGSSNDKGSLITEDYIKKAVIEFQRFAGLNQTGILDNSTMTMMNMPRCGVKDKVGYGLEAKRKKRYALQGSRWRVNDLTYRISKYPSRLTKAQVDEEIDRAFKVWSDYTNLRFIQKTSGNIHIDVRFVRGEHGDGDPFDGTGGTLAHAYFPIYGGDAHFDEDERWTINSYRGSNLFQVAAHEFGHSLGLSHSDVQAALMAPFYRGYQASFKLHQDDIKAIQSLYGEKRARPVPKQPPPKQPGSGSGFGPGFGSGGRPTDEGNGQEGELCSDSRIDAIFSVGKRSYVFKGDYYWEVADEGLADGYPRQIKKDWKGLPSNIDAAFTYSNGKTYFFKDNLYWRFKGMKLDEGYPKRISQGFNGVPEKVDAAFMWSGNDKVYFFKGSKYWKFDQSKNPPVSSEYPKAVSLWTGIPNNINAAFQYTNGFTYFFQGTNYWRFNDRRFRVDYAEPPFPRSSAMWWFGCKAMSSDNLDVPKSSGLKSNEASDEQIEDASNDEYVYDYHPDALRDPNTGGNGVMNSVAELIGTVLWLDNRFLGITVAVVSNIFVPQSLQLDECKALLFKWIFTTTLSMRRMWKVKRIFRKADSSLNFVLDVPWSKIQHLLQESDSVLHSSSLNQSRRSRTNAELSGHEMCQNCQSNTREFEERLAEVQQQLTVAVSSNYTKNVMIEQLDKTLSKIVEGWKKLESEKFTQINKLERERNTAKEDLKREQEVLIKVERELTLTLDKLMLSQKEIQQIHSDKQTWMAEFESKISKLSDDLTSAQNQNSNLTASNKMLIDEYENKLRDVNNKYAASIQEWELLEDKFKSQIRDNHMNLNGLQQEKIQNEHTVKTLTLQLQLLRKQLDDELREKESLKVEVSILQARNSAAKNEMEEKEKNSIDLLKKEHEKNMLNLEKKLIAQYEKKSSEMSICYQKSFDEQLQKKIDEDARERAVLEVEYEKAMQEQAERYNQQMRLKDTELERQHGRRAEEIQDLINEIRHLQKENCTLASSRSHLMARIQDLLQNQWQESLKILYGSSNGSQPPLKLSLSSLSPQDLFSQNLSDELDYLPSCEIPTSDYESVNVQRVHVCKARVQKSQSQSQIPVISSNLLPTNSRTSFKASPPKKSNYKFTESHSSGNYSKGLTLTLPPTDLFDDFYSLAKPLSQKCDSSDDASTEYCLVDEQRVNENNEKNRERSRHTSSLASRRETTESISSYKDDLPPKIKRKTQSLLERIPIPDDELSKLEYSDNLTLSDIILEPERTNSKSTQNRFRSGADRPLNESINRHEERQTMLKKYLEELLRRPPGEPFDASKELPCKDESNIRQPQRRMSNARRNEVPRLHLPNK